MPDMHAVRTVAWLEAKILLRSRSTALFGAAFAALSLAIAYFGSVTAASAGFQGFERTTASLLNLVLYLIPMIGLASAVLSFTGEKESFGLLFSQPVRRSEILLGKMLGLFLSIVTATIGGFGLAGLGIASQAGPEGALKFAAFVGQSLVLALAFLSLGTLLGTVAGSRARALAYALFAWFFFVILYDLLVTGLAFLIAERPANRLIFLSIFGNPVDLARVSGLITLSGPTIFGAAGAALVKYLGGAVASHVALLAGLAAWVILPLAAAARVLRRQDI